MNINLKSRLENKTFWISLVGAAILLLQQLKLFNLADYIPNNYADIINSIFAILTMLGITVDTSTPGMSDDSASSKFTVSIDGSKVSQAIQSAFNQQPLEVKNLNDNPTDSATQNTVQVSNDSLASSKIQVANPNNLQAIGQEVSHISADKPQ